MSVRLFMGEINCGISRLNKAHITLPTMHGPHPTDWQPEKPQGGRICSLCLSSSWDISSLLPSDVDSYWSLHHWLIQAGTSALSCLQTPTGTIPLALSGSSFPTVDLGPSRLPQKCEPIPYNKSPAHCLSPFQR